MNNNYDDENKQLDYEKRLLRRRWARIAFGSILFVCAFYLVCGLTLDKEQAEILSQFNSITITMLGFMSALVAGFFGIEYATSRR